MNGGYGDDTFYCDSALDQVFETAGEGYDLVKTSASWTMNGQSIEKVVLTGTAAISVLGNGEGTSFEGNSAGNVMDSAAGGDSVSGYGGDDTIYGRRGADNLYGGTGVDTIYGGLEADIINGAQGADQLYGEGGDDSFLYGSAYGIGILPNESGPGAVGRDFIYDFDLDGDDKINLWLLDAKPTESPFFNDSFVFIGAAAFTAEGQIRATSVGQSTLVEVNYIGTLDTDMSIYLKGTGIGLVDVSDFVL
jgi:Ca2+-binding RTX toxin-like protein